MNPTSFDFDVLIVGSGLAGLSAAVHLAPTHRVAVLTKRAMSDGSSGWAQGGIAAVLADDDSFAAHIEDTLVAGAGLCDLATTRFVVENAPESIAWLRGLGVPFTLGISIFSGMGMASFIDVILLLVRQRLGVNVTINPPSKET